MTDRQRGGPDRGAHQHRRRVAAGVRARGRGRLRRDADLHEERDALGGGPACARRGGPLPLGAGPDRDRAGGRPRLLPDQPRVTRPGAPGAVAPGLPRRASPGGGAGPAVRHHPPRGAHGGRGRGRAGAGRRVARLARGAGGGGGAPGLPGEHRRPGDGPGRGLRAPRRDLRAGPQPRTASASASTPATRMPPGTISRRRPRTTPRWRRSRRRSAPAGSWRSISTTPRASGAAGSTATSTSGGGASAWSASGSS